MKLKLGTRKSELALWQARKVRDLLDPQGIECEIVKIESFGDQVQDIPLHKLGDKGVFTKALDIALLKGEIDLAVHSLKDVPTEPVEGLMLACVPVREDPSDVLVRPVGNEQSESTVVATGSIRRRAFWLNRYPGHEVTGLRGNVPTRLQKIDDNGWSGGIFAHAGLIRLGLDQRVSEVLGWMIPAPAQGAVGIVTRNEEGIPALLRKIENIDARLCTDAERAFLNRLEAGCSSPVGALAEVKEQVFHFHGAVLSVDGKEKKEIEHQADIPENAEVFGREMADKLIENGALDLMSEEG